MTLAIAAVMTWAFAATIVVIGIGSIVQWHGRFSAGVGIMLLAYGAILAWIGWAAWTCRFYVRGALVASSLLHLLLALSSLGAGNVLVWLLVAALNLVILVCAFAPPTTAALRRARRTDDPPESSAG